MNKSIIIVFLFCLLAVLTKIQYLWGVDTLSFFPDYISFFVIAIALILLLPQIQKKIEVPLFSFLYKSGKFPVSVWLFVFAFIAFLFHQNGYLLGDGLLRIRDLEHGLKFSPAEPLDTLIHAFTFSTLNKFIKLSGAQVYAIISVFSGMASVFGYSYYSKRIFSTLEEKVLFGILIFGSAWIQLFFGYAESYSVIACLNLLFFMSAIASLTNNKFSIFPVVFLSSSVVTHPASIIFAPACFYFYYRIIWNNEQNSKSGMILKLSAIPISILSVTLIIFSLLGYPPSKFLALSGDSHIMPFFNTQFSYGIFSFEHPIDLINQFLLVTPAIFILPFVFKGRLFISDFVMNFILIGVGFSMLMLLLFRTDLGFARDWDLFSIYALPMLLFLGFKMINSGISLNKFIYPLIILIFFQTFPWLILNSSEDLSIKRAERMVETPYWTNHQRAVLYDEISQIYFSKEDLKNALDNTMMAYRFEKMNRYYYSIGLINYKMGKSDTALVIFNSLLKANFKKEFVLSAIGGINFAKGQFSEAAGAYKALTELQPQSSDDHYNLGLSLYNLKLNDSAEKEFLLTLELNPNNALAIGNLSQIYSGKNEFRKAIYYYNKLIEIEPSNPEHYYNLALCYSDLGEFDTALKNIQIARSCGFDENILKPLENEVIKAKSMQ